MKTGAHIIDEATHRGAVFAPGALDIDRSLEIAFDVLLEHIAEAVKPVVSFNVTGGAAPTFGDPVLLSQVAPPHKAIDLCYNPTPETLEAHGFFSSPEYEKALDAFRKDADAKLAAERAARVDPRELKRGMITKAATDLDELLEEAYRNMDEMRNRNAGPGSENERAAFKMAVRQYVEKVIAR